MHGSDLILRFFLKFGGEDGPVPEGWEAESGDSDWWEWD